MLVLQAAALVVVTSAGLLWSKAHAIGALIGAAIGLVANAYMAISMLGKPMLTGVFSDVRVSWTIKVVMTVALLWVAMRANVSPPPAIVAGFFATLFVQWLAVSFWLLGRR